jgi:hypothetical protein
MQLICIDDLNHIRGGMHLDPSEVSTNIDDRRGETRQQARARQRHPEPLPTLPPLVRHPGDLSSQAGLDDIKASTRRRR